MKKTSKRTSSFMSSVISGLHGEEKGAEKESERAGSVQPIDANVKGTKRSSTGFEQRLFHAEDAYRRDEPRFDNSDLVRLEPTECRIWAFHNRRYDLLDDDNCSDLIEGFQESGRQELPGIIRRVTDDSEYEYEVIAGARRHWTCAYLGWKYLAEIRDLSDEEAFILADVENRARKDISDYERAVDYRRALNEIFSEDGELAGRSKGKLTQEEFAKRLGKSKGWLSQFLYLAELPPEVLAAFPRVTDIGLRNGRELKPVLEKASTREKVITAAIELAADETRTVKKVMKNLLGAGVEKKTLNKNSNVLGAFDGSNGKRAVTVKRRGKRDLTLDINRQGAGSKEEALALLQKALDTFY